MTLITNNEAAKAEQDGSKTMAQLREQLQGDYDFDVRMLTNRSVILGTGDPGMIGARLLENGLRYGSVLGRSAAQPFWIGAVLAFNRATKAPQTVTKERSVHDALYNRFLAHYGLFVAESMSESGVEPLASTRFETALTSLTAAFTGSIVKDVSRRPASFQTAEFSSYALTTLSFARIARLWQIAVPEKLVERIGEIQVHKQHDRLRKALHAILNEESASNERELSDAFRATFNLGSCTGGLIANLQFTHAYACSLARFRGQFVAALTNLLHD